MIEDEAYEEKEVDKDVMYNIIPSVAMHSNTDLDSYASVETWLLTNKCSDANKIWDALLEEKLHYSDIDGIVAWDTILNFIYEEGLNSPRWNNYGGK